MSQTKTTQVYFNESIYRFPASKTITIPNLKKVVSVTINTGRVSYSVNGDRVTVSPADGAYTRYTTSTRTDTKEITHYRARVTCDLTWAWIDTDGGYWTIWSIGPIPKTYYYNVDGYTGTLISDGYIAGPGTYTGPPDRRGTYLYEEAPGYTYTQYGFYDGTVSKKITEYTYYYAYTVTITYIDNANPTLSVKLGSQVLSNNQIILISHKNNTTLSIIPTDIDIGDTLKYSISLRGTVKVSSTNCTNGVPFNYNITYSDLIYGNNVLTIYLEDDKGGSTSFTITLRNKEPLTLCQKEVYNVAVALGYNGITYNSLGTIKPANYTSQTLSLRDIINFMQ